jgi:poly-gamma-glutamate synthesis protein (capsule biosynthesis protein)
VPTLRARIVAVGDLLMHVPLVDAARTGRDQWDFWSIFADTAPWIRSADIALANLETNFAGPGYGWSGFPVFNTPDAFAQAIVDAGFDAVTLANNHILDYSNKGLARTIAVLDAAHLPHTGAATSPAMRDEVLVFEPSPGLRVALLAYTYNTNNPKEPNAFNVNLIDAARLREDVRRARRGARADIVVVALHVGTEYTAAADVFQERAVRAAFDAGADVVLGNHPHVVHRAEFRDGRAAILSLGNFVSAQGSRTTQEGVLFVVDVVKDAAGARVEGAGYVPIVTQLPGRGAGGARVVPIDAELAALADDDTPAARARRARLAWCRGDVAARLQDPAVTLLPPAPSTTTEAPRPPSERVFVPREPASPDASVAVAPATTTTTTTTTAEAPMSGDASAPLGTPLGPPLGPLAAPRSSHDREQQ